MEDPTAKAVNQAAADGHLTADEWRDLEPKVFAQQMLAGQVGRSLVTAWANPAVKMDTEVESGVGMAIRSLGYDVVTGQRPSDAKATAAIIETNIGEPDANFHHLRELSGAAHAPVTIGVIDGGMDVSHPALAGKLAVNVGEVAGNGVDDDGNQKVDDRHGWDFFDGDANLKADSHGTHVAGLATAGTTALAAFGARARTPSQLADAIDDLAARGARVVNLSIGLFQGVEQIAAAMARHPGVLFVVAAGNGGSDLSQKTRTRDESLGLHELPNAVMVASSTANGMLDGGSNYGARDVALAAPGTAMSAINREGYDVMNGTSQAAPRVTNLAGKLLALDPGLTPTQLLRLMAGTSTKRADWAGKAAAGGPINPSLAMKAAVLTAGLRRGENVDALVSKLALSEEERKVLVPLTTA